MPVSYFNNSYLSPEFARSDYIDSTNFLSSPQNGNVYAVNILFDVADTLQINVGNKSKISIPLGITNDFIISLPVSPSLLAPKAQFFTSKFLFDGFAQSDYFDLAPTQITGNIYAVNVLFDTTSILQINTAHISPAIVSFDVVNTLFVDSTVIYIPFLDIVTTFTVNAGRITPNQIPIDVVNTFSINAVHLFGSAVDIAAITDFNTNTVSTKQSAVVFDNVFTTTISGQKYLVGLLNIDVTATFDLSTGATISVPVTLDVTGDLFVNLLTTNTLGVKLVYFTLTSIDTVYFTLNTFRFKNV